jgi:glycine hydroxymethyltransferase
MAHVAGLIAGGVAKNPLDYGFHVMTSTTHKTLRGPRGGMILSMGTVSTPLKAPEKTIENIPTLIDRAVFPGTQGGPHMNNIAAKAVALQEAAQPEFAAYAEQVVKNAAALAEALKKGGLKLVTGGTKNHLILANVYESFGIDGKEAQERLEAAGITVNANAVPDDTLPPYRPSGIRLGTPAVTTRGLREDDMVAIAQKIISVLSDQKL